MVIEWLMGLFEGLQAWFLGLFGDDDAPDWIETAADFIADIIDRASGLGAWFPFVFFAAVFGFMGTLWGIFWLVKGIRWLWGLTPFSGGS